MARPAALLAGLAVLQLAACQKPAPPPRAAEVSTITATPRAATFSEESVAQIEAVNTVEIRPRVTGVLEKQLPNEGQRVRAGELLFVIDRQPYIAALAQAKATLAQSEAALEQSRRDLDRAQSLSQIDAVSQQELDATVAKNKANIASVEAGRAAVRTADLNLGYTEVASPIDGVMGRALLRLGGLVTANSTLLTTLYQTDRMYINMTISEQRLLALQQRLGRALDQNTRSAPPFRIFLADGSEYHETPRLNFIDPAVDQRTGTLGVRLEIPNPQGLLHAGQFARVRVATDQDANAFLVPQRAVQDLQGKNFLWLVGPDGKAQQRDVEMGPRLDQDWQVLKGLKAGDVVIVDGVQHVKAGVPVKATPLAAAASGQGGV